MIDSDREQAYSAEDRVIQSLNWAAESQTGIITVDFHGSMLLLEQDKKFGDVASMQTYVDMIWPLVGTGPAPTVRASRSGRRSLYRGRDHVIHMSMERWSRREIVLLHEIAHAVVRCTTGSGAVPAHGPVWRRTYPAVVEAAGMGTASLLLRDAFSSLSPEPEAARW